MYRTQFFSATSVEALQEKVNDWLAREKNLFVVGSNMTSLASAADQYAFYILYEVLSGPQAGVQEMVADQKTDADPLTKIDLNML